MKLTINGQTIAVELENTVLGESLRALCPVRTGCPNCWNTRAENCGLHYAVQEVEM